MRSGDIESESSSYSSSSSSRSLPNTNAEGVGGDTGSDGIDFIAGMDDILVSDGFFLGDDDTCETNFDLE